MMAKREHELLIVPTNKWYINMLSIAELATDKRDFDFFYQDRKEIHKAFRAVMEELDYATKISFLMDALDLEYEDFEGENPTKNFSSDEAERRFKYLFLPEEKAALAYSFLLEHGQFCDQLLGIVDDAVVRGEQVDLDYEVKTIKRELAAEGWTKTEINNEFRYVGSWLGAFKRLAIIDQLRKRGGFSSGIVPISSCSLSPIFPELRQYETMAVAGEAFENED